jgi:hypothetical protein
MFEVICAHNSSEFGANQFQLKGASFSDALAALSQEQQDAYMLCLEYSFLAQLQKRQFAWTDVSAIQMCQRLTGWSSMHCRIAQLQDRLDFHHDVLECFIDLHRNAEHWAQLLVKDYIAWTISHDGRDQSYLNRHILQEYAMSWKNETVELLLIAESAPILFGLIDLEAERLLDSIKLTAGVHEPL